jgi:hypothetical protein
MFDDSAERDAVAVNRYEHAHDEGFHGAIIDEKISIFLTVTSISAHPDYASAAAGHAGITTAVCGEEGLERSPTRRLQGLHRER